MFAKLYELQGPYCDPCHKYIIRDDYKSGKNTIPPGAWLIKDLDTIITGDKQNIRGSLGE